VTLVQFVQEPILAANIVIVNVS